MWPSVPSAPPKTSNRPPARTEPTNHLRPRPLGDPTLILSRKESTGGPFRGCNNDLSIMDTTSRPDLSDVLNEVSADAQNFWYAQRDHTLLVASEKAAKAGRAMVGGLILFALVSMVVLMVSMAAAYLVADRVGSLALGFLYVGCGYLVVTGLFLVVWKSVLGEKVQLTLINAFYDKD